MESRGKLIILLVAGLVVAFGAISVYHRITSPPELAPAEAPPQSIRVIIARRDVPPGTFVQVPQDIDWEVIPPENVKDNYLREGTAHIEDFNGAIARRPLRAGEPVVDSALMKAGEGGFMSAVLEPGMRAVSVSVNAASGNAGFVSPGDRVDLIVTRHIKGAEDDMIVSELFVEDVRVVAVDQMLDNPENKAILAKTVTVEVFPRQAEKIAAASERGKISVALRSLAQQAKAPKVEPVEETAGEQPVDENTEVVKELYGSTEPVPPAEESGTAYQRVRVFRGDKVESVELK